MAVTPELQKYIEGSSGNEEAARRSLAAQGPSIIPDLLDAELRYLKHWGESKENFAAAFSFGNNVIEKIRTRGERLVKEIASSSPQNGQQAGTRLAQLSSSTNAGIRAISILLCMQPGVPRSTYSHQVMERFLHDNNDIVRIAAAVCMATISEVPLNVMQASINVVMGFLTEYVRPNFSELENELRFQILRSAPGMDEGAQNLLIVANTLYYFLAIR